MPLLGNLPLEDPLRGRWLIQISLLRGTRLPLGCGTSGEWLPGQNNRPVADRLGHRLEVTAKRPPQPIARRTLFMPERHGPMAIVSSGNVDAAGISKPDRKPLVTESLPQAGQNRRAFLVATLTDFGRLACRGVFGKVFGNKFEEFSGGQLTHPLGPRLGETSRSPKRFAPLLGRWFGRRPRRSPG
jgi:hypothetical protein